MCGGKFAFQNRLGWLIVGRKFAVFALVYLAQGAYIRSGDVTEGFLRYEFEGAYIWRGLYKEGLIFGILRNIAFL